MERITYRKTLDVHKSGIQFMLQGFETADNLSRVIEISLMASGDAIDFPLERTVAMMYVTTPGATEPSINKCTIKDNKVVYEVLPITVEGITTMQIKLIETSPEGATSVIATPKFAIEVSKSDAMDDGEELSTTFTAIEEFIAKADAAYGSRLERIELSSDCIFRAFYADGSTYETDILQKLFLNGNVLLSESFAHGGTGVRTGEDTDNSKYYSYVSRSEALNAKSIMANSENILEEVKLHGVYTAFSVDFKTGEVEYVSPSFKFNVNLETGELDAEGQTYSFNDEIGRVVEEWLAKNGVVLSDLQKISTQHSADIEELKNRVTPIDKGGTGAATLDEAKDNLGITHLHNVINQKVPEWSIEEPLIQLYTTARTVEARMTTYNNANGEKTQTSGERMINDGEIYVHFVPTVRIWDGSNCGMVKGTVTILHNNDILTELVYEGNGYQSATEPEWHNKPLNIPVQVRKGDTISIRVYTKQSSNSTSNTTSYLSTSVSWNLYANQDTIHTYYDPLSGAKTPTADEILNALLGEE